MIKYFRNFMARRTLGANLRNKIMNTFSSYEIFKDTRVKVEALRQKDQRPHEVLYFHKVDDPYSHLTIQSIKKLQASFDIELKPVLVGEESLEALHEPTLYNYYCLQDVQRIAPFYDIEFPAKSYPAKELVIIANSILSAVDEQNFVDMATQVSFALWSGDSEKLDAISSTYFATSSQIKEKLNNGNEIRNGKGYYFGSAFYYEKELYWGLDRLPYLEERLTELGARKKSENNEICTLKLKAPKTLISEKKVNLYYYPSLNSPYTFVSTKRIREIRDEYPVNLHMKPVLPMLMRMMNIPTNKAKYILSDAAREGRKYAHEMKTIYSPIGKPARKSYSLFPAIDKDGKGFEYIEALLKASFQDGINIGDDNFLEKLVIDLGLDWRKIKKDLNSKHWKKILNDNVQDMYSGNCWGVPSFKITDEDGTDPFYVWGQDRIWLLKEEIARRLS